MPSELLLDIKDLRVEFKVYGGILKVVDGVNFKVYQGEKVGLVGETGCGKTTTMKAILRILPMPPARLTTSTPLTPYSPATRNAMEQWCSVVRRARNNKRFFILVDIAAARVARTTTPPAGFNGNR